MKKKKGFTLIEILAVIIILAILALILIPIIARVITSSKKGAAVDSAYGYIKAVEYYRLNLIELNSTEDDVDTLNPLVHADGKLPSAGYVVYTSRGLNVEMAHLCINGYSVKYENGKAGIVDNEHYCNIYIEPEGDYIRELCEGTKTYNSEMTYKMKTAEDLVCFSQIINNNTYFVNAKVIMVSDIDITNNKNYQYKSGDKTKMYGDINGNGTVEDLKTELTTEKGFNPIGRSSTNNKYFKGVLDGDNFTLSNLMINRETENYIGLFGYSGATIKNFNLDNYNDKETTDDDTIIKGKGYVGGLVGYNYYGTLNNVNINSSIKAKEGNSGGVVGYNSYGTITKTHSNVIVVNDSGYNTGGLVGYNDKGTIRINWITSKVRGTNQIGGLFGRTSGGTIVENVVDYTEVIGGETVGGLGGSGGDNNYGVNTSSNLVRKAVVSGSNYYVSGAIGYSWTESYTNGVIVESGSSNKSGVNACTNCYYLSGFNASSNNDVKKYRGQSKNVSAYDNALDTWIGGDNDNSGWYFRQDQDGEFQLVSTVDYPITFNLEGLGTEESPYLIKTTDDWNTATIKANQVGVHFKIVNNLDFTNKEFYKMGSPRNVFNGVLDGNNKTISGITLAGGAYTGLIGYAGSSAEVKNIVLDNNSFNNSCNYAGALIGYNNTSKIHNTKILNNNITNSYYAGGITGYNNGASLLGTEIVLDNINVSGSGYNGLITGYNNNGTIKEFNITGKVTSTGGYAGGITGYNNQGFLTLNHLNVEVGNSGYNVGGLVGYNDKGTIRVNWITSKVRGTNQIGGLFGRTVGGTIVENVVESTEVIGGETAGGLGGSGGDNNYGVNTSSNLVRKAVVSGSNYYVSGAIGYSWTESYTNGVIVESGSSNKSGVNACTNCYYLSSFNASSNNDVKKYRGQSKNVSAYDNALDTWIGGDNDNSGWYFRPDSNGEFQLVKTSDYPITFNLEGLGTEESPYLIKTTDDWNTATIKANLVGVHFRLENDLDFTNKEFYKMGSPRNIFSGVLDGNNKTISGITLDGGAYTGLIGYASNTAEVKNIILDDIDINNTCYGAGILTGYNLSSKYSNITIKDSTITNSSYAGGVTGYNNTTLSGFVVDNISITGSNYLGGLVGQQIGGLLKENHIKANISATGNYVGGIAGTITDWGTIRDNWITTTVSGVADVGGIVGEVRKSTIIENVLESVTVSGNRMLGGLAGYGGDNNGTANISNNLIRNISLSGTGSYYGAAVGSGWSTSYVHDNIIERGSVNSGLGYCTNCYYLSTLSLTSTPDTKISSSYYNNLTKYDEILETAYDGDTNGTGYFFGYNQDGIIDLVKENYEPEVTPCTENCPTDDELETVVSTGTGTCEGEGADITPPTCTFIRSYPVSNGIAAELYCTDDQGAPEVASLFNSTTNQVYSYEDILARGSIKTGKVVGNTRNINSRWTTSYIPNQPAPGLCYYYQYGAKDSCGNWTTYTTNNCYYGFSN